MDWTKYESNKFFSTKNYKWPADYTIDRLVEEAVGQAKEMKPVVYVREDQKGLVLNVSRAKVLRKAFGDDERRWPGKRFRLLKVPGFFGGEACEMLVVQAPAPSGRIVKPAAPLIEGPLPNGDDDEGEDVPDCEEG